MKEEKKQPSKHFLWLIPTLLFVVIILYTNSNKANNFLVGHAIKGTIEEVSGNNVVPGEHELKLTFDFATTDGNTVLCCYIIDVRSDLALESEGRLKLLAESGVKTKLCGRKKGNGTFIIAEFAER